MIALTVQASAFVLPAQQSVTLSVADKERAVVHTAVSLLQADLQRVLSAPTKLSRSKAQILVATWRGEGRQLLADTGLDLSWLDSQAQAFILQVTTDGRLVIAGSDSYGTAYGIIELTRLLGVSPWEWWADVEPDAKGEFRLDEGYLTRQSPNVAYRGIFINDEDWGLMPWSATNYEPSTRGQVGPKTTERIFELMLRLRANLYWPPMHECTYPFFLTDGCKELAAKYGIMIGTSHCEPMGCNAATEWAIRGKGDYNWDTNRSEVLRFWDQRVKESARVPQVYTLGMRGLHDGPMQGITTLDAKKLALTDIFKAQRELLATHVNPEVSRVPQVFIPYKEVLEAYNAGLQVPDDVTLMWCDDNYGYIRHFPTDAEQRRSGGNGVYYHASYWGRPHDYLWLGTASPFLMFQQLYEAYYHGAQRMWVLNVGDIKPLEYQISLFMDMAWDIEQVRQLTVGTHLEEFYAQNIGRDVARLISIYMKEYYHLAFQCKPEHLAGTRVEEPKGGETDWTQVRDMPWSEKKLRHRLSRYDLMQRNVRWVSDSVRHTHPKRYDAFFQLVEYPVMAAAAQCEKYHLAQLARHCISYLQRDNVDSTWRRSDLAHNRVQELTIRYNEQRNGKWRGIMSSNPRALPVFQPVPHVQATTPMPEEEPSVATFYGASYDAATFAGNGILAPVLGLGASIRAMPLPREHSLTYNFKHNYLRQRFSVIEIHLLPTHPIDEQQRFSISLDGSQPLTYTYNTVGRSEEWKQNVLRNYAVVIARPQVFKPTGEHSLVITALDDGVVIDEVIVRK
ncbi:MAG: glycosyl hydrolase 115 family protein [Bacteroidaceae bacterium]|nr:glycosyl hydrolase 115 family protein [Bacteroidaceae bacterium]